MAHKDSLPPLPSEMDSCGSSASGLVSPSGSAKSKGRPIRLGLGGLSGKMGLGSATNGSRCGSQEVEPEGTTTPTGRTTPTQSNPYGPEGAPGRTPSSSASPQGGDGNTVAQLYAVFGLPKDPSVWTLAEEDCVAGVHHMEGAVGRFWRPEVLGCSICPSPAEVFARQQGCADDAGDFKGEGEQQWEGISVDGKKGSGNPKFIEMADGRGRLERTETARVLSKALKVSLRRNFMVL